MAWDLGLGKAGLRRGRFALIFDVFSVDCAGALRIHVGIPTCTTSTLVHVPTGTAAAVGALVDLALRYMYLSLEVRRSTCNVVSRSRLHACTVPVPSYM